MPQSSDKKFIEEMHVSARKLILAAMLLASGSFASPGSAAENWPDSVDAHVMEIRKLVSTVAQEGYLEVVKNPGAALIIDVRDEDELKAGMVPGAINISRGRLEFRIWRAMGYPGNVDTARRIYVQCATGGRATLAAKQLKDIGFTNVVAVVVNMAEWEKKGLPLVVKSSAK